MITPHDFGAIFKHLYDFYYFQEGIWLFFFYTFSIIKSLTMQEYNFTLVIQLGDV